jgi:hypothetical protein
VKLVPDHLGRLKHERLFGDPLDVLDPDRLDLSLWHLRRKEFGKQQVAGLTEGLAFQIEGIESSA